MKKGFIEVDIGMADGVVLDYLVAQAEGLNVTIIEKPEYGVGKLVFVGVGKCLNLDLVRYNPSVNPALWAPLIEKYKINIQQQDCPQRLILAWHGADVESWSELVAHAVCRVAVKVKLESETAQIPRALVV